MPVVLAILGLLLLPVTTRAAVVFDPDDDKGVMVPPTNSRTQGLIRVAYDETSPCIDTVVMIAVGTAMSVGDYSILSRLTAQGTSIAVVVADHRPNNLFKQAWVNWDTDPRDRLLALAMYVQNNIGFHVHHVCADRKTHFILGGHSASALTVGEVLLEVHRGTKSYLKVDGVVGLDPEYRRLPISPQMWNELDLTHIPSVMWGHSQDSCQVMVNTGGKYGYEKSSPYYRVLYQMQWEGPQNQGHCDLTNDGCMALASIPGVGSIPICVLSDRHASTKQLMALSIQKLATAVDRPDPSAFFEEQKREAQTSFAGTPRDLKVFWNTDTVDFSARAQDGGGNHRGGGAGRLRIPPPH